MEPRAAAHDWPYRNGAMDPGTLGRPRPPAAVPLSTLPSTRVLAVSPRRGNRLPDMRTPLVRIAAAQRQRPPRPAGATASPQAGRGEGVAQINHQARRLPTASPRHAAEDL